MQLYHNWKNLHIFGDTIAPPRVPKIYLQNIDLVRQQSFPTFYFSIWGVGPRVIELCESKEKTGQSILEMCMGMGFPMRTGIPRESQGNGNEAWNWEWEWEGMETTLMGMGITCIPWGFIPTVFAAFNLLSYSYCFSWMYVMNTLNVKLINSRQWYFI